MWNGIDTLLHNGHKGIHLKSKIHPNGQCIQINSDDWNLNSIITAQRSVNNDIAQVDLIDKLVITVNSVAILDYTIIYNSNGPG